MTIQNELMAVPADEFLYNFNDSEAKREMEALKQIEQDLQVQF